MTALTAWCNRTVLLLVLIAIAVPLAACSSTTNTSFSEDGPFGPHSKTDLDSFRFELRLQSQGTATIAPDDPIALDYLEDAGGDMFNTMAVYTGLTGAVATLRGEFLAPDRVRAFLVLGELEPVSFIQVGWGMWKGPDWQYVDQGLGVEGFGFLVALGDDYTAEYFAGTAVGAETVNGMPAVRYHLGLAELQGIRAESGRPPLAANIDDMTLDLWRTVEGVLVQWNIVTRARNAAGDTITTTFDVSLSRIDDPDIEILPPR